MYNNFNLFVNIQVINGQLHVATLDKHDVFSIKEDFEIIGNSDVLSVVKEKLNEYYYDTNVLFILEQKEFEKTIAIRYTPLASDLDAIIKKYPGRVDFIPDWSLLGYRVYGNVNNLKQGKVYAFIKGRNDELGVEIGYPFNGLYTVMSGGTEIGFIALAKCGREFEDGSYGTTTVAEVLLKGHKPTYSYSLQCEIARLCLENYLRACDEKYHMLVA